MLTIVTSGATGMYQVARKANARRWPEGRSERLGRMVGRSVVVGTRGRSMNMLVATFAGAEGKEAVSEADPEAVKKALEPNVIEDNGILIGSLGLVREVMIRDIR